MYGICLPFDITATTKRVIINVVDNLNMVELFVSCWSVGCELMVTSSVQVVI